MLAAISVEGRAAGAERGRKVVDGEPDERHRVRPVVAPFAGEGARTSAMMPSAVYLAGCVVVVRRAEDQRRSQRLVQTRPEALMKRVSRSETSASGRPTSRNTEDTKLRTAVSAVAVRVKPDPARQQVNVRLHEVMARPGRRELDGVEADAPPASCRHRPGE